jgi:phosphoribosylanthranilate isomerase
LRKRLGPELRILRVVHFDERTAEQAAAIADDPNVAAVLVDSRTAKAVGGTGMSFDWIEARRTVFRNAGSLKLIAAGGLTPANVAEAIATLQPWGVDVATGVESTPGRKDIAKVRDFIARAKATDVPRFRAD